VWSLGMRDYTFGFTLQGLWFRVWGSGFIDQVQGTGLLWEGVVMH
jgi:hypothetical protein